MEKPSNKMPYGRYKGWAYNKIPAAYLLLMYNWEKLKGEPLEYVKANYEALSNEVTLGIKRKS